MNTALEEQWYPVIAESGSFQAYEYLNGNPETRERERLRFEHDEVRNPSLDYPALQETKIRDFIQNLTQLKRDIATQARSFLDGSQERVIAQAYRWKVNEKLAEANMLLASLTGHMRRFQLYAWFVYGKPSRLVFTSVLTMVRERTSKHAERNTEPLRTIATKLLALLPSSDEEPEEFRPLLSQEIRQRITQSCKIPTVDSLEDAQIVNAAYIEKAFNTSLRTIGATDWQVTCTRDKTAISVDQEQKIVWIPDSRTMTGRTLRGLIAHEILTHVARRHYGEKQHLRLLGLGLDRYEQAEEGIATIRELCITEKSDEIGTYSKYLAIGLAHGFDGDPKDFRGVYTIIHLDFLLQHVLEGKSYQDSDKLATKKAWNTCVRTFRGTNCTSPGVYFPKDMIYLQGRLAIGNLLLQDPDSMSYFNVGKYDPTNHRHTETLKALRIT